MIKLSQRILATGLLMLLLQHTLSAKSDVSYKLNSPDKKTTVNITFSDSLRYSLLVDGKMILNESPLSFTTDLPMNKKLKVVQTSRTSVNTSLVPVIKQKMAVIPDVYNQLRIDFSNQTSLEWRAYNNGVAWRWITRIPTNYKVVEETAAFSFNEKDTIWYPQENSFYSGNEPKFTKCSIEELGPDKLASLPVLFDVDGMKVLVTESNLLDYAGMWLMNGANGKVNATFPYYPKEKEKKGDRDEYVLSRENYIAQYTSPTDFPWRIIALARNDNDLLTNTLVYQLAQPSKGDFSWVEAGKAQWDWWNNSNIYKVNFKVGMNTETYKYFIDFAARNGLKYIVLDEGWYELSDIMRVAPAIDMEELVRYGKEKNVGLILWCTWLRLDEKLQDAMDQFGRWGIKAIKVDFMSRDDQEMVKYYTRVSQEAAKRHILVDFHGCYKPTGLYRTYPNVITYEGVYGLEQSKGDQSKAINPDHNVLLPFTRMVAGPMDYTPGAMGNAHKDEWQPNWNEPMSIGTRCHQLAMYVVYESPLQMLADSPTKYMAEPECMEFLSAVPTTWSQTIPACSKVGKYVSIARQSENGDWFLGAMTNSEARALTVKLDFLPDGDYEIKLWKDGVNAVRNAKDFSTEKKRVNKQTELSIEMVAGGGFAAIITKL